MAAMAHAMHRRVVAKEKAPLNTEHSTNGRKLAKAAGLKVS
jgi:hypothetical protein